MRRASALAAAAAAAAAAPAKVTRVLPLGDSITFGCGDQCGTDDCMVSGNIVCPDCAGGYRGPLYRQLDARAPGAWAFAGSQLNGPADISRRHEGHPGWTCEQIQAINTTWAAANATTYPDGAPDVVLLHLGTNNLGIAAQNASAALGHMDDLLRTVFAALPGSRLLLATLIGSNPGTFPTGYAGEKHAAYNAGIKQLATQYAAAGKNVELVDMEQESGIGAMCDDTNCCPQKIHPNDKGYVLMADVWFKHLTATL